MFYEARISEMELLYLADLLGQDLTIITPVVWDAQLFTGSNNIGIVPEEVLTPDQAHPHATVDRIKVTVHATSPDKPNSRTSGKALGKLLDIEIISTIVTFSPVETYPPQNFLGVTIPASTGHGYIYFHPLQLRALQLATPEEDAMVFFDIAIKLVTDFYSSAFLFTRGYFVNAVFDALPNEEWVMSGSYERCSLQSRLQQSLKRLN